MEPRQQDRLGIALIALSVACTAVLLGVGYASDSFREQRDERSGCLVGEPPAGFTALVVDETDALSDAQIARLEEERDRILARVGPDEMVSIYVVDERSNPLLRPELAICSPGAGRDANPLYQNPRKHEARFQQEFAARLDAVIATLQEPRSSPTSPILETLYAVTHSPGFQRTTGRREIVIVSDLLENVPEFSHYGRSPSWDRFHGSAYAARIEADLLAASVRLIYLRRVKDLPWQGEAHLAFWKRYFDESGGGALEVLLQ